MENKMKIYSVKPTKKQLKAMKIWWAMFKKEQDKFYKEVQSLEIGMSDAVGINGLEFFMCDNEYVGIGNYDRTLKLLQKEYLEK
jgi:hypothetical protein